MRAPSSARSACQALSERLASSSRNMELDTTLSVAIQVTIAERHLDPRLCAESLRETHVASSVHVHDGFLVRIDAQSAES
jgi:hypothetical protein